MVRILCFLLVIALKGIVVGYKTFSSLTQQTLGFKMFAKFVSV